MITKRLFWQLYFPYLFITLISLITAILFFTMSLRSFYYEDVQKDLEARARLINEPDRVGRIVTQNRQGIPLWNFLFAAAIALALLELYLANIHVRT